MTQEILPNFFHCGAPKAGSSWLYRAFDEHPEICVLQPHEVQFFNIHYHRGLDYYKQFYQHYSGEKMLGDTTTAYLRDIHVPARIAKHVPAAKIIISVRNPIDRAYSHYWHEKKKLKINFEFEELWENYDLFEAWIVTGLYHEHIQRYLECFLPENILVLLLDDLEEDPLSFANNVFRFLGVKELTNLSIIGEKINKSRGKRFSIENTPIGLIPQSVRHLVPEFIRSRIWKRINTYSQRQSLQEYEAGMDSELRRELYRVFEKDIEKLGQYLGRDLSSWR